MKLREVADKLNTGEVIVAASYLLDESIGRVRLRMDETLPEPVAEALSRIIARRHAGEPLQYAIGRWSFYGRDFKVDNRALIPRPETELLVERVLAFGIGGKRICDVGTGTGIIPLTLALETAHGRLPQDRPSELIGVDISDEALSLARENDRLLRGESPALPIRWVHSDALERVDGVVDLIVANPPYLTEAEYRQLSPELYHEPKLALVAGREGLAIYERLIEQAHSKLTPGGAIFFEIGQTQGNALRCLLEMNGFSHIEVFKDYNGFDRIVHARKLTD